MDDIIRDIEKEIAEFELYRVLEDSPMGGNVVKAAMYGGHVAGLRSALNRLLTRQCTPTASDI